MVEEGRVELYFLLEHVYRLLGFIEETFEVFIDVVNFVFEVFDVSEF